MAIKKIKVWDMGAISFDTFEDHQEYMKNFYDDTRDFNIMRTNLMIDNRIVSNQYIVNSNILTVITTFSTEQDLLDYEQHSSTKNVVAFLESMGWSVVSEELTNVEV